MNIDLEIAAISAAEEHVVKDFIEIMNQTPENYLRVSILCRSIIKSIAKRDALIELQDRLKIVKYSEADIDAVYNAALTVTKADVYSSAHK